MLTPLCGEIDVTCNCTSACPAGPYPVLAETGEVPLDCPRQVPVDEAARSLREPSIRCDLQITFLAGDVIARRAAGATLEDLVHARQLTLLREEGPSPGRRGSPDDPPPPPDPEPVPPPTPRDSLEVCLRLAYEDAEGRTLLLPPSLPVTVVFDDGAVTGQVKIGHCRAGQSRPEFP
jgi:hypothetical protein